MVHNTNFPVALKLNFLLLKLDPRTRQMICSYRGHDYFRTLQAIVNEYSSLASAVAHKQRRAHAFSPVTQRDDLESLVEIVEQLRAVNILFDHYDLSMGLEMEIFRIFLTKFPESFSDRYLKKMHNDTPSLAIYLEYLDDAVATVRTRRLWLPYHELEMRRFSFDRGRVSDSRTFALGPTAFKQQWVNHADWEDHDQDQDLGAESQYYVEEVETDQEDRAIEWHSRPQLTAYACLQETDNVRPQQLGHERPQRLLGAPYQPLANEPLRAIT